ncbi:MAG: nucleotide exchange factor GrpE [Firmicutes bacterium]|nr:nucleotide exchange factor GrpE [Bacillota bacterium]
MADEINRDEELRETAEETAEETQAAAAEPAEEEELSAEAREMREAILNGDFDVSDFLRQYKEAQSAKAEAEERSLRVQADFDNFRRRSRKDAEAAGEKGKGDFIIELLPVLDNFERAMGLMSDGPDKDGVDLILKQLQSVLANAGMTELDALDQDFDPNLHHAVLQEPSEDKKGKVLMVLQKGYMLGDRLLRPAMVQVGV